MSKYRWGLLVAIIGAFLTTSANAEQRSVQGVVTHVDSAQRMITVRNDITGERRSYFLAPDARVRDNSGPMTLIELKRGQSVTLTYQTTDRGRQVAAVERNGTEPTSLASASSKTRSVQGEITGVRPMARTVTVRQDNRERITLRIAEDANLYKDGRAVRLRQLYKGDQISAKYRITDRGPELIASGPSQLVDVVSQEPEQPQMAMVELPKTASNRYAYLFAGLFALSLGLFLRQSRRS